MLICAPSNVAIDEVSLLLLLRSPIHSQLQIIVRLKTEGIWMLDTDNASGAPVRSTSRCRVVRIGVPGGVGAHVPLKVHKLVL